MTAGEQDGQQITAIIQSSIVAGLPLWTQRHLFALECHRAKTLGGLLTRQQRGWPPLAVGRCLTSGSGIPPPSGRSPGLTKLSKHLRTQRRPEMAGEDPGTYKVSTIRSGRSTKSKRLAGEDGGARLPEVGGGLPGSRVRLRSAGRGGRHGPSISRGLTPRRAGRGPGHYPRDAGRGTRRGRSERDHQRNVRAGGGRHSCAMARSCSCIIWESSWESSGERVQTCLWLYATRASYFVRFSPPSPSASR
jgi:hypothetical protein